MARALLTERVLVKESWGLNSYILNQYHGILLITYEVS